jgi:membrane protein implicated in regulation of membrane protease activity
MLEYMVWFWLAFFVIALVVEVITADMISIWFALASIPSFIIALVFEESLVWQIVSFILISGVLLFLTRPVVKKYLKTNEIKTNVDAMVGVKVQVTKVITPESVGRVVFRSLDWAAISKETINIGEYARVLDVDGNKLIVEKID